MWFKNAFFKYATSLILIMVIIFMFGEIEFFLKPFKGFIAVLITPILLSLAFYYLFRPLVAKLRRLKISKSLSIVIVFLGFILSFSVIVTYAGAIIVSEFKEILNDFPQIIEKAKVTIEDFVKNSSYIESYRETIEENIGGLLKSIIPSVESLKSLNDWVTGAFSTITGIATIFVIVPFVLFYFLRDDMIFYKGALKKIPTSYRKAVAKVIRDTDKTIGTYVISQATIALILGVLTYIGYLVIGLDYAFILATFVCITSFIPILGVIIGVVPALVVGLSGDSIMLLKIIIIIIIVQQIEGNFISPYIMGKSLKIHPLTVILIFLAAASVYGFIGMLLVVPTYAVLKVLGSGGWRIYKLYKNRKVA